jgi:hypothetical protein
MHFLGMEIVAAYRSDPSGFWHQGGNTVSTTETQNKKDS